LKNSRNAIILERISLQTKKSGYIILLIPLPLYSKNDKMSRTSRFATVQ